MKITFSDDALGDGAAEMVLHKMIGTVVDLLQGDEVLVTGTIVKTSDRYVKIRKLTTGQVSSWAFDRFDEVRYC